MLFNQINHFQKLARKNFEEFGELSPVMFGLYKDPETGEDIRKIIGLVFDGQEDKDALTNFLCDEIRNNNLKEYLLILESWITEMKEGIPKRSECVMMVYGSANKEKVCMSDIARSPDRLGEWKNYDTKNMEGRFLGLFKKAVAVWN